MLPKTAGPTKIMPSQQDASHIVRIAVELENQTPQLIKFDRTQPLTGTIPISLQKLAPPFYFSYLLIHFFN